MRISYYKMLHLAVVCFFVAMTTGCSETVDFHQPQLSVSEKEITFTNQMGEKVIAVNTNCKDWIVSSPQPWVHLTQNDHELNVKVDANNGSGERSTYILVDGGLAVEKITVRQSASDQILKIQDNEIILPQNGGVTMVDINEDGAEYEIKPDAENVWVKIVKKKRALKFISEANYGAKERSFKLSIVQGGKNTDVTVKQPGVSTFVLACNPGTPFSLFKMMDFEYRRGGMLTEYGAPDPTMDLYEETYIFRTPSPLFQEVFYVHDTQNFMPTRIFTRSLVKEGVDAVRTPEFQEYVKANGYERDAKDPNHYVNQTELMTMDVDILESNNSVVLFFNQMHIQDRDYETFESLELGPLHLLDKTDKKIEDVEAYEKSQNSEEIGRQISKSREIEALAFKTTDPVLVGRTYFFYMRGGEFPAPADKVRSVEQYSLSFSNPNLGIWQHGREWFVTKEFNQLLTSNDFEFIGYNGMHHVYARRSDNLTLAISGGKFADMNGGQPVMQISVLYKKDIFAGSKERRMSMVKSVLKRMSVGR